MKILFIMNSANVAGGGQVSLLELLRLLDRKAFEPTAVVSGPGDMQQRLLARNVPTTVIPLPSLKTLNVFSIVKSILDIKRLVVRENFKLVHSNDSRAHFYAGIAAWLAKVPSVFHFRVSDSDGWYDRVLPRLATRIVAVSESAARRFPGFHNKLAIVYNGVDTSRFAPGATPSPDVPLPKLHSPLIGTIGRVGKQKGIDVLLKTLSILIKDFPTLGAVIVGKDETGEDLVMKKLCTSLGLDNHVAFVEYFSNIPAFMASIDLFVLLSDNEGFSRSLLEAMACGKPVVATNVGGNPEIVDDSVGKLVAFNNPEETAAAIKGLLMNPALRKHLGATARKRIENRFGLLANAKAMSTLFLELTGATI